MSVELPLGVGPAADCLARRVDRGDDRAASLRMLRRRLCDVVFAAMLTDERNRRRQPGEQLLAVAA